MVDMNEQQAGLSMFSFKLVYKIMLIAGFVVVVCTAILNYAFLQRLAEPRMNQVKELADTTSIVVSELALASFYNRSQERISNALSKTIGDLNNQGGGFLQISVILYPSGIYYASTNQEFVNRKVGLSLLKKLELNESDNMTVEKLNYEFDGRKVQVLHFLRNIIIEQNDEKKKIAVTQILFDYGKILNTTRQMLFTVAAIFFFSILLFVWIMYLPLSRLHKRMIKGFVQISNKNFDYKLRTRDQGEIGVLFDTFNKMTNQLKNYFQERQQSKMNSVINSIEDTGSGSKELALRKADITCLCARIPNVHGMVEDKAPEDVAESIAKFVDPLEIVVQEYGGQVIKILGDKVYVLFEGINSIDNSIRTALKVNQKWQVLNHERKVLGRKRLDFGLGLHSAEGVAGTIGHHSVSYTVVGKAASVAEYLCASAKSEEILVSASLMDKASGSFPHRVLGEIEPVDLGETEQVLVVTNLQYSDDVVLKREAQAQLGIESSDGDVGKISNDLAGLTGTANIHDSSIPDMLEETLSNAPLDSVTPPPIVDKRRLKAKESGSNKKPGSDKKQSLWDEFEK